MVYGSAFVLLVAPAWRIAFYALVRKSLPMQQVLFAGTSPTVRQIVERLRERPEMGLEVMGFLGDGQRGECGVMPCLGKVADIHRVVEQKRPQVIVVGKDALPTQQLLDLRLAGFHLEQVADLYETVYDRVSTHDLDLSQVIFSSHMGPPPFSVALQNVYSYVLGFAGVVVTAPIMAVVALLVRFSSPGPVLFRQLRVGLHGTPFMVLKFRSMYADAEADTGAVWATKDDPRVTPVGRWLRRLRLDELPQFVNVIRGEMSFVGPRPERPEYVTILAEKLPIYNFRHFVKPGITGWAQINHKYGDTIEDSVIKLEYDLYYIKNLTPALDAYIIFHTLKVMLLQRGAQ
jgi:exopolysaccharide biosynthesis polyprenyl glycosylphosphotransferase